MRVFLIALAAAIVIALVAHSGLDAMQRSAAVANTTEGTRLNQQESVDFYGREG
jgi:hypothetical protein